MNSFIQIAATEEQKYFFNPKTFQALLPYFSVQGGNHTVGEKDLQLLGADGFSLWIYPQWMWRLKSNWEGSCCWEDGQERVKSKIWLILVTKSKTRSKWTRKQDWMKETQNLGYMCHGWMSLPNSWLVIICQAWVFYNHKSLHSHISAMNENWLWEPCSAQGSFTEACVTVRETAEGYESGRKWGVGQWKAIMGIKSGRN